MKNSPNPAPSSTRPVLGRRALLGGACALTLGGLTAGRAIAQEAPEPERGSIRRLASAAGTTPFVATEMSWRYDGPVPAVRAPGPFTIQQFVIRIGKTAIAKPGANFDGNLTEPLTQVFNGQWTYYPDTGFAMPHAWGGPNASHMPLSAIRPISTCPVLGDPAGGGASGDCR